MLLFVVLTFLGIVGFRAMKAQNFPDVEVPEVLISASLPGASPSQLENDVAIKIENAVAALQGLKHIKTTLTDGSVNITVEFQLEKPVQEAVDDVRDAVARVRADLPAGLRDPTVKKAEFATSPILTYTVASSQMDEEALSWFVDDTIGKTLLAVRGAGTVSRVGGVNREIRVELDPAKLMALKVTAGDISRQLRAVQQESAAGKANLGDREQSVRTIATALTAHDIAVMDLALSDGRRIRLDQVARVLDTVADQRSAALLDGHPVVGFEVTRARGAGELEVASAVRDALAKLRAANPGIELREVIDYVQPVKENYDGSMQLLCEGAALAVVVVLLFLRDWRATAVSALAVPLSVIPTFAVMHLLGFSLNLVTLLSLSLIVGILVDDAIVEIENITRHLRMGKTPHAAAMEAADEIGLAVIATSFTLIAVFLPTAFMQGAAGRLFVQFGWTAAIAVFFSLVVARVLTPMMAANCLTPAKKGVPSSQPRWIGLYVRWAVACLRHRWVTLGAAFAFFALGLLLATRVPGEFLPSDDVAQTQVTLSLPPGSTLTDTLAAAEAARHIVSTNEHVKTVYTAIGGGITETGPGASGAAPVAMQTAVMTINLSHRDDRPGLSRQRIEGQLRDALELLPGVRVQVSRGGSDEGYVVVLTGPDSRVLTDHAALVERELRTLPGVGAVTSSAGLLQPELVVRPDFARAADLGVTSAAISDTLRIATSGDFDQELAKLNLSKRQVPIVVRMANAGRQDIDALRQLPVPGARGHVPLASVASLATGSGPAQITRHDRARNIDLTVESNGTPIGEMEEAALSLPSLQQLPPGVSQGASGEAEAMDELSQGFGTAMVTGVLCIYVVLVLLLKDFVQPMTILVALVLSIPGAFVALYLAGATMSVPSMIGLIMLMGISTKNSILIVDYAVMARLQGGLTRDRAIVDACRKRARPVVMTTMAMGVGMLPVALGWGGDPSFRSPMAVVVIGGLISSTVLSLFVIPVVYTCLDDLVAWLRTRHRGSGRRGGGQPLPVPDFGVMPPRPSLDRGCTSPN
jgi:multidrug efflux pump subunit AcrB